VIAEVINNIHYHVTYMYILARRETQNCKSFKPFGNHNMSDLHSGGVLFDYRLWDFCSDRSVSWLTSFPGQQYWIST